MAPSLLCTPSLSRLCIAVSLIFVSTFLAIGSSAAADPELTDSLYAAHHPRLLFTPEDLPDLYNKVRDGGSDAEAYNFIRLVALYIYPGSTNEDLLDNDFGLATIPNLGLAGFLESPVDTSALALGRQMVLYIKDNYQVDSDVFYSSLRLRALALGYDMFFGNSSGAVRDSVRREMISYIDTMTTSSDYSVYLYRPYLANKSVMIAASLGLAAIALEGETDPNRISLALGTAKKNIDHWINFQIDPAGAYKEGVLYGAWSLRNLVYYFWARKKYDGLDYSTKPKLEHMLEWFPYELLPEGNGRTNNLNDCAWDDFVLSRHNTFFNWAQAVWGSGLASWLWEYTAGDHGWDWGLKSDKASTVLWNLDLPYQSPETILPQSSIWPDRGLYYYRSGWNFGSGSQDVVLSFYSGVFEGGHAQEDQGQFTLYAYGSKFAIDHGPGTIPKESSSHNIILIDGLGQHNAGSSIGTDGLIQKYLLSGFSDFVVGDQTAAYTTYSQFNKFGYPLPLTDWSWGYDGGNPVDYAYRTIFTVHDTLRPPYFILIDEIEKDGLLPHLYEWRMHTHDANSVDAGSNPIHITRGSSALDMYLLSPPFDSVQTGVAPFQNLTSEPDAKVLSVSVTDVSPTFIFLLFPRNDSVPVPVVSKEDQPWGFTLTLDWGDGVVDVFIRNEGGASFTYSSQAADIIADAPYVLTRFDNGRLSRYLLIDATSFTFDDTVWVNSSNGPLSCAMSDGAISLDRYDSDFTLYGPDISDIHYRSQKIFFIETDGYLTPDPTTGLAGRPAPASGLRATVFPNPFNPSANILIDLPVSAEVEAVIYDLQGRLVRRLLRRTLPPGQSRFHWNGTNEQGAAVASGVYFLRLSSPREVQTLKLILVK